MNKNELAKKVAEITGLPAKDMEKAIDSTLDVITDTIKSGQEVMLTGFGVFSSKIRHARNGVNPLNPSQKIHIPEVLVAKFKAGKALKDALKGKTEPEAPKDGTSQEVPVSETDREEPEQETIGEEKSAPEQKNLSNETETQTNTEINSDGTSPKSAVEAEKGEEESSEPKPQESPEE